MTESKRRILMALGPAATLAAVAPASTAAAAARAANRVLLHVSDADPQKWTLTLNNVHALQEAFGRDAVDIEIVANGPGVNMLKRDSAAGTRVAEALRAGVKVYACQNTMRGMKLTSADMLADIGYTPSGVAELVSRQREGFAYVHP